ncbi:hypothetical protein L596_023073 [Steinernema carpocapsae]|uniref:Uncharacterized protein n=1 Tax=Steinernema carpocapsae TaxID=34508 RepID=A0A4U5MCJ7_STECR|nr:hypothetical protein L596_023073 [Steinernema carpocapsae]
MTCEMKPSLGLLDSACLQNGQNLKNRHQSHFNTPKLTKNSSLLSTLGRRPETSAAAAKSVAKTATDLEAAIAANEQNRRSNSRQSRRRSRGGGDKTGDTNAAQKTLSPRKIVYLDRHRSALSAPVLHSRFLARFVAELDRSSYAPEFPTLTTLFQSNSAKWC